MKVVYLTWGETPRSYGVFGSQAIGQFIETQKLSPNSKFHFISAVPIIHSGLFREKWRYFSELSKVKMKLGAIAFHWLPIVVSQNFVFASKATFKFMHGTGAHWLLKNKLNKIVPDIVHCRSYHSAWAALTVRKKYGLNFKIIFDGRGPWPEEVAFKQNWSENSSDYQFLKSIEKKLLFECDASVSVSDTMHQHYAGLGAKNDQCIYLSTDTNQLKVNFDQIQQNERIQFCYVGALSENTWHQPKGLVDLYRRLRTLYPKTQLTIVTTSSHDQLKVHFSEFPKEELVFTSTKTRLELKHVLTKQDFGILALFTPINEKEKMLARSGLAVKTVEYLAAGLPIICNAYCEGAAKLIDNHGLGITYFPENVDSIKPEELLVYLNTSAREKCEAFALKNFDYTLNAQKYFELYKRVLNCQ
jgi:glycosyltransferase involved in cell wall biosynthesis